MGGGRFTDEDWRGYSSGIAGQSQSQVFNRQTIKASKDPRVSFAPATITARESRDSATSPQSTPIILAFDVTGSMGRIPYEFVQTGLGVLMKEIFDRAPVSNPHVLCMAVGDAYSDRAPLQVTQFEADIRIAQQLQELYLEGNGGGNEGESYNLAWLFAALKTSADSYEKRGKKGLLFTIGDEPPHMTLRKDQAQRFLGIDIERDLSSPEVLALVRRQYDVFHVVVEQGSGLRDYGERMVVGAWNSLLGEGRVLRLSDYTKLSEVVISAIQVNAGVDKDAVISSWSGDTSLVVAKAIQNTGNLAVRLGNGRGIGPVKLAGASPRL